MASKDGKWSFWRVLSSATAAVLILWGMWWSGTTLGLIETMIVTWDGVGPGGGMIGGSDELWYVFGIRVDKETIAMGFVAGFFAITTGLYMLQTRRFSQKDESP